MIMDTVTPRSKRSFTELSGARCLTLLEENSIGRIVWQAADGPQIFPVTYAFSTSDGIVFRTSPYGVLSELVRRTQVAFEVERLDPERGTGWVVVAHGQASAVAEPAALVALWADHPVTPWASGTRNLWIRIVLDQLSGRVVADAVHDQQLTAGEARA